MFPLLFRTDLGFIYTFTVVWLAGLFLSASIIWRNSSSSRIWWDGMLVSVLGALILGRIQFIWENAEWYAENPAARFEWQQGGHGYAGAILGAIIALYLWKFITKHPIQPFLNHLIPVIPLLHFAGWTACYFDGCGSDSIWSG